MKVRKALVWFRHDLRLTDHVPLARAAEAAEEVYAVYCLPPQEMELLPLGFRKMGAPRAQFLLEALADLRAQLQGLGGDLIFRLGAPEAVLPELARLLGAKAVFAGSEPGHHEQQEEQRVEQALWQQQVTLQGYWHGTLYHRDDIPWSLAQLPAVFTQFRKQIEREIEVRPLVPTPQKMAPLPPACEAGVLPTLEQLGYQTPTPDKRAVLAFQGGELAGKARVHRYFWEQDLLKTYKETRNGLLGADYSSKLSPWLALGCLSPRWVAQEVRRYEQERVKNQSTYWLIFELMWRDYFQLVALQYGRRLFLRRGIKGEPLSLPMQQDEGAFRRWQRGTTGVPFIDANLRELAATGFMSNRGRQNVASFLVKDMGLDWRWGAQWFESQLLDYDVASNWGNWNYVAGIGNDPRENRYFNWLSQARRYDGKGDYVRHWLPELSGIAGAKVHHPSELSEAELLERNVRLGKDYPWPIVDMSQWVY